MTITVHVSVITMLGIGEEWLVDEQERVRAVFIDGQLRCTVLHIAHGAAEKTVSPDTQAV